MKRRVVWTESAWQEVECAAAFIARDSPRYASALTEEAVFAARSLRTFPNRGRKIPESDDPEIRELFVKRYRLIYRIEPRRVLIVAFIHGARDFRTI